MRNLMYMRLVLTVTMLTPLCQPADPEKPSFNLYQHVTNVSSFFFTVDLGRTKYVTLSYDITFRVESCCPVLAFGPYGIKNYHVREDNCLEKDFANLALLSGLHMPMPDSIYQSKCKKTDDKYISKDIWKFFKPLAIDWAGNLNYDCRQKKNMDIMLNMTFHIGKPQPCEDLQSKVCGDMFGYNKTIFPNLANHQSQKQTVWLVDQLLVTFIRNSAKSSSGICHQHFAKVACFILFPNCRNGAHYTPCRQMCLEVEEGCSDIIQALRQPVLCEIVPDSTDPDVCFYEPVICHIPEDLEFGTVTYEGRNPFNMTSYVCYPGYRLEGDAQRACLYSGRWNGTAPTCVAGNKVDLKAILISAITAVFILLSVTAVCVWKRRYIKIFFWDITNRGLYQVNEERKNKLFLTYSAMDNPLVDNFLPELKREIPTWDITTFQQDFQGGKTIIGSIHDGVWNGNAMIALLTENYVQSEWCQYEFTQAKTRSVTDPNFICIIILQEGTEAEFVENLPRPFHDYAKSRIYLTYGEVLFWRKLRRALHGIAVKAGP